MIVRWARQAQRDLIDAEDFLLPRNPLAAATLSRSAVAASAFLADHPRAGALIPGRRLRRWRAHGTRYLLLYRLAGGELRIVRLLHDATNWNRFV